MSATTKNTSDRASSPKGANPLYNPPFLPCAQNTHEPFRFMDTLLRASDDYEGFWGIVSTTSWQFEGDRTDLHDVWSLCWAAFLRAAGLASTFLIDEDGWCGPEELSARHLLIRPTAFNFADSSGYEAELASLKAWTALGFHLMDDVFDWRQSGSSYGPSGSYRVTSPRWAESVLRSLRRPKYYAVCQRARPYWIYFSVLPRGVSIVRLANSRMHALKAILAPFEPRVAPGENALAIVASGIANAVPLKTIRKGHHLLKLAGDPSTHPLVLPIDSHCLFLGEKTIVAIREDCSRAVYEAERELFLRRRQSENQVFFTECDAHWRSPLDAGSFESLCLDLVRREPGVVRAKPVGGLNDRDGGRDILIDWRIPESHDSPGNTHSRTVRIIAQIKSRGRSVGKQDVQDIRDTVERHGAAGYFLIAHPRMTASLVDHLDHLRSQKKFVVDWWEARDLEGRLRRHPDIAQRYPQIVELVAS